MKLTQQFSKFLDDEVNLNISRLTNLEQKVSAITTFIENSNWQPEILSFVSQGSWAHQTIIKPVDRKGFDADLIVMVKPTQDFSARDYVNKLKTEFSDSGIYKDKIRSSSHCVTVDYAGDFSIDIAPCVQNRNGYASLEVCNRTIDEYQNSNPEAYNLWIIDRNTWSGEHGLKKVTRLLKYLRDIKLTFTCPSVLLTTLVGNQIIGNDGQTAGFADVPTSLKTIINRLDDWLQRNATKPEIKNPVLVDEKFSEQWTDDQYQNFRDVINRYRTWIDEAFDEPDFDESIKKWRRVFGDDFGSGIIAEKAVNVIQKLAESIRPGLDAVEAVLVAGKSFLDRVPASFPHMQIIRERFAPTLISLRVTAYEKPTKSGDRGRQVISGDVFQTGSGVEFIATQANGLPLPDEYNVLWQIVNTGPIAARAKGGLRGDFKKSDSHVIHWEQTSYRGVHWAQAFAINKRNNLVVGKSERFFVVIQ